METYNIFQAKTHLSELIQKALNGEEIIISKAGKPLIELKPLAKVNRKLGLLRGKVSIADDFEAPLPSSVLTLFTGENE